MARRRPRRPHGFRRRLTAAFILVAAISAGGLAVLTYGVTSSYRWGSFERVGKEQARVALALAPDRLDDPSFEHMQAAFEKRSGMDTVALVGGRTYTSAVGLTGDDVPDDVLLPTDIAPGEEPDLAVTDTSREGHDYLVVAGDGPDGARYVFFFAKDVPQASLRELRTVLAWGWLVVVALAAAVGHLVARRTLRPVRQAAEAASALAGGLMETRLPAEGEDEFRAWSDSFNDMADALQATIEELRRTADRQRQLTADVAHDLRTPLTGMAVTAQVLEEHLDELPAPSRRAAAVLVRDVDRLRELVLDLLELTRLDEGADPVLAEPLDLRAALDTTLDALPLPDGVAVAVDVPAGLGVSAERGRLRRVLSNLVANAAVHGGRSVTVAARREGDTVRVDVHDDGPGIDPERAERIFDRFYKSDASRAQGGSGLGLAIAREHARAMGGDIVLDPGPGRGATFTLLLCHSPVTGSGSVPAGDRQGPHAGIEV